MDAARTTEGSASDGGHPARDGNPFRELPSVEEVLSSAGAAALAARVPRALLAELVARVLDEWRAELRAGRLDAAGVRARREGGAHLERLAQLVHAEARAGLAPAVNATGVVLHTGLGRAPLHSEVAARMAAVATGYCTLEVDRRSGARGRRDARAGELVRRLSGAEAAIAVNNNAAAVLLVLQTFAGGRTAVVSRGELVEIGGSFRVPDIMQRAGARLVEVGTTNRTRRGDYERAIDGHTGLLMKVHTSNFRQVGFTESVAASELAEVGRAHGVTTAFDLGSGLVDEGGQTLELPGETSVREAVASGVDLVTFSGDKLLGGPQAGLVAGRRAAIEALRANPIYRALRLDKVTLAGLEATLELYLAGRADELPARRMLQADAQHLRGRAAALAGALGALPGLAAEVTAASSAPGSGSAPGVELATSAVRVTAAAWSPDELAARLRAADPPVFARIQDGALLVDPRTLLPGDEARLVAAFGSLGTP